MRRGFAIALCALFGLLAVSPASAALEVYEGFSQPVAGSVFGQTGSGIGFTSNSWTRIAFTGVNNVVTTGTLAACGVAATGGKLIKAGNGIAAEMARNLPRRPGNQPFMSINPATTETVYISALMRKNGSNSATDDDLYISWANTAGTARGYFGINGAEQFTVRIQRTGTNVVIPGRSAAVNTTYLLICRMDGTNSSESLRLKVYDSYQAVDRTEPATYDASYNRENTSIPFEMLSVFTGANTGASTGLEIDEIRVGRAWTDVIPPKADLLVEETFDYPAGALAGAATTTRTGITQAWRNHATSAALTVADGRLGLVTNGRYVSKSGGGAGFAFLGDALSMGNVTTATRYLSALMSKGSVASSVAENVSVQLLATVDNLPKIEMGIGSNDQFYLSLAGSSPIFVPAKIATPNVGYLLVARVTAQSSTDTMRLSVFENAAQYSTTEPPLNGYDRVYGANSGATSLDRVQIALGSNTSPGEIDDFRMGLTWASVVSGVVVPVELSAFEME